VTQDYLWIRSLKSEPEGTRTEQLVASAKAFQAAANIPPISTTSSSRRETSSSSKPTRTEEMGKAAEQLASIASAQLLESALLETKQRIFQ
jgi:hypothetical protein